MIREHIEDAVGLLALVVFCVLVGWW